MKFSTYVALIATVSAAGPGAPNPVKIVDGVAFEDFQREALKAARDAKEVAHEKRTVFHEWGVKQE